MDGSEGYVDNPIPGVNVSACSQMQKSESRGGSEALAFDFC